MLLLIHRKRDFSPAIFVKKKSRLHKEITEDSQTITSYSVENVYERRKLLTSQIQGVRLIAGIAEIAFVIIELLESFMALAIMSFTDIHY